MESLFVRLPALDARNEFLDINVNEIKYIRAWKDRNGNATSYKTIIYFKDGHDVKIDDPEPTVSKMLKDAGVKFIGYVE